MNGRRAYTHWVAWGVTGLALLLLALLIQAPAALLPWLTDRLAPDGLRWRGVSGTLWQGQAEAVYWQTQTSVQPLGRLSWRWRAADLASARLAWKLALSGAGSDLDAELSRSLDAWHLRQARGQLSANVLGGLWPAMRLIHPQGRLELAAEDFRIGRDGMGGEMRLDWRAAVSALVTAPLGEYRLRLTAGEGGLDLNLDTLQGPLQAQGQGRWRPGEGMSLSVEIRPPTTNRADYAPALDLLARADAEGTYRLIWSAQ